MLDDGNGGGGDMVVLMLLWKGCVGEDDAMMVVRSYVLVRMLI